MSVRVKRIVVGSFYVSPNSPHKAATIEHIIETIHILRARYDNEVNFFLGGDFNNINDILDAYGALNQLVSVPTRQGSILEIILTDLHSLYHPPTTLPPLEVDPDKIGKNSDHNIIVIAPLSNHKYEVKRTKKSIITRPLPISNFAKFEAQIQSHNWSNLYQTVNVNDKVHLFHKSIRTILDENFPEKLVKISNLDKKWMSPELKQLHRQVQYQNSKDPPCCTGLYQT